MLDFQRDLFKRSGLYRALGNSYDLGRLFGATITVRTPDGVVDDFVAGIRLMDMLAPEKDYVLFLHLLDSECWHDNPCGVLVYSSRRNRWEMRKCSVDALGRRSYRNTPAAITIRPRN